MPRLPVVSISALILVLFPGSTAFFTANNLPSATLRARCGMSGLRCATDKIAVVTGSTDGIGKHTATKLASDGYKVCIHGRSQKRIDAAVKEIKDKVPDAQLDTFLADFASLADVKKLSDELHQKCPKIDVLINNAGVFEQSMKKTPDGNEMTFQVNVLTPFLLTSLLLDLCDKAEQPRIIIVSSISQGYKLDMSNLQMEKGFSDHASYSLSKLCNAMHAIELAERLKKAMPKATVNTLDPGTVNTKMLLAGWGACGINVNQANYQYQLATDPDLEGVTGQYFVGGRVSLASPPCYDPAQRLELWSKMEELTGASYELAGAQL
mmetsp:Transcript_24852/g.61014  ORF Transcript_24852/g.61014 Transcript_24852/m.61014 type:complete len:323 (-) Transcript_24852:185-1153(-)|eukprot:CAMPEP_0206245012 /NCGR_PEP_ID=MMETSP0047_2-20121206/18469_1 /ASSEMBLY_ACC=CAM_ASM_000192 /TAXON_ID=195065 /ORGANISM="Chroomonas mesostigmatica_cf, Strain CCMP1168" /LENGTH=322 /DNA_ID=CAMNT_0053670281 /DNA_START=107 /DNA_END=1075 /DNA_ORIENTATION=-